MKIPTPAMNPAIKYMMSTKNLQSEFKKDYKAHEIFELYRKHDLDAEKIVEEFKDNLSMAIATVVNILDPDAIVFGGGVSNEITFLDEIKEKVMNNLNQFIKNFVDEFKNQSDVKYEELWKWSIEKPEKFWDSIFYCFFTRLR